MGRIFVVEDEPLISMLIEDMLTELGHEVLATAQWLDTAIAIAADIQCDLAVLDINLNGKMSLPVAQVLHRRGIPFFFASGYGRAGLDNTFIDIPVLAKPFSMVQFERTTNLALAAAPGHPRA